jgi:HEAT repeat protein
MGQDNQSEEFHAGLLKLLEDPQPVVRRNAAVQLVRFNDARGRRELLAMLQPFNVNAPFEGKIESVLTEGGEVRENTLLARIGDAQNQVHELRSPLSGKLTHVSAPVGTNVSAGAVVLTLAPDPEFVFEALRALFLVGQEEDLPEVERYANGVEEMPERVKQQAAQTLKAIRSRLENKVGEVK